MNVLVLCFKGLMEQSGLERTLVLGLFYFGTPCDLKMNIESFFANSSTFTCLYSLKHPTKVKDKLNSRKQDTV